MLTIWNAGIMKVPFWFFDLRTGDSKAGFA
jgi:hypothetical protein